MPTGAMRYEMMPYLMPRANHADDGSSPLLLSYDIFRYIDRELRTTGLRSANIVISLTEFYVLRFRLVQNVKVR